MWRNSVQKLCSLQRVGWHPFVKACATPIDSSCSQRTPDAVSNVLYSISWLVECPRVFQFFHMDGKVLWQWKDGFKQRNWVREFHVCERLSYTWILGCMLLHQRHGRTLCVQPISFADCFQTHGEIVISDKLNSASPFVKACATPIDSSCSQKNVRCCQQCFVLDLLTGRMSSCFSIRSHGRRSVMTVKRRLQANKNDLKVRVLHQRRGRKLCVQPIPCADYFQKHEEIVTFDKLNLASPLVKVCADSTWFNESGRLRGLSEYGSGGRSIVFRG